MAPSELTIHEPIVVAGLSVRTTNGEETDPARARIPALWGRFFAEGHAARGQGPIYSVYSDYESDVNGAYTVLVGRKVGEAESAEGAVTIPPGSYLVFTSRGEMPEAVQRGWGEVWRYFSAPGTPRRSYAADFELYDPASPDAVRIHVGIE